MTADALANLGVLYHHLPATSEVDVLAANRGYKNRDEIVVSPEKMGDVYEDKVKMFFNEHLHEDEEIRYIRGGQGYFDVRNQGDEWVRIQLEKDDLIILPAGIFHRFTTDESNVRNFLSFLLTSFKVLFLCLSSHMPCFVYYSSTKPSTPTNPLSID